MRATVWWLDAHGTHEAHLSASEIDQQHKGILLATTGWLVKDDEIGVSLAFERFPRERAENEGLEGYDFRGIHFVPRAGVVQTDYWPEQDV